LRGLVRFPLLLWWGPDSVSTYTDAYRPILGAKHPWALGTRVRDCWSEVWSLLRPLIDTPFRGGPSTWNEEGCLELNDTGQFEETHFTVAHSPVPDETASGGIGGVLATVHEVTGKVIGDRRAVLPRDLGAKSAEPKTAEEDCEIAARILSMHPRDIPFALIYIFEPGRRSAGKKCIAAASPEPSRSARPTSSCAPTGRSTT
jgi:hypothetical protein